MKRTRHVYPSLILPALFCLALSAQIAKKPAPAAAAPKLSGFPFQDESLRYSIKWPSGLSLGDVTFSAHRGGPGWTFDLGIDAGVPGSAFPTITVPPRTFICALQSSNATSRTAARRPARRPDSTSRTARPIA